MPERVDHRHCKECGRVTAPDDETCSPACAARREQRVRSVRNYRLILYGAIALLAVVLLSSFIR